MAINQLNFFFYSIFICNNYNYFYFYQEPNGSMPPRLMQRSQIAISAERGSDVHLTCSAQGSPPPTFTWYRDVNGKLDLLIFIS